MKGFTIYSPQTHSRLTNLLDNYCKRIKDLTSSNPQLNSLLILLCEVNSLFTAKKDCYKTMNRIINHQNKIERCILGLESRIQDPIPHINSLQKIFKGLKSTLHNEWKTNVYLNSEEFYTKQIEQLEKKEKEINSSLKKLEEQTQKSGNSLDITSKEALQYRKKIINNRRTLEEEQLKVQKQLDAQNNLKKKIEESFTILSSNANSIDPEQERLEKLFSFFRRSMIILGIILLGWVMIILLYWLCHGLPHALIYYIPFYLPIPVCGGLLWASIFQMNRTQKQLLFLANQLHHIHYIESLLLVHNNISFNINEETEKIKSIVERIIEGYIHTDEKLFKEQIEKDNMDIQSLFHLVKEIKEIISTKLS